MGGKSKGLNRAAVVDVSGGVTFTLLDGVGARFGGRPVDLGHARQRVVLVALLVDAGRPVPAARLVERVWGGEAPQRAYPTLYTYVSRLRHVLAAAGGPDIVRHPDGYVLDVALEQVDLHRFGQLVARGRATRDDRLADVLLGEAFGLWRAEPFGGLDTAWLRAAREDLTGSRLAAELDHAEVLLRLGRHAELVARLGERAQRYPRDDRLAGLLMLALHRSGRTTEALRHFDALPTRGPALARVHREIMDAGRPVPRQLPPSPARFAGRAAELAVLDRGADVPVWVLHGARGTGKTWLALRWANGRAPSFPDGQLHADLHDRTALEALRGFVAALGVPGDRIPQDPDALAGLYRSTLAGRRVLVVLDGARDPDQVRPLLPGSPGCVVVVTSRSRLTGLVAADGAWSVSVGPHRASALPHRLAS